jgi:Na+/H+ antiporter NhaD/arsenite permease-like protein
LFILVGGAQHAGLLKDISDMISALSMGNGIVYLLLLMWSAALCAAFLNAGPAAAFFIPMLMHGPYSVFNDTVWWALSFGILAGSCATLTGATGGIVAQTLVDENELALKNNMKQTELTFHRFSQRGVPIALTFLAISSIYITVLAMSQGIK